MVEARKEQLCVHSDAFPDTRQPVLGSRAHEILVAIINSGSFSHECISLRKLTKRDEAEMKILHAEWFPINYRQSFFDRMKSRSAIAIGCFYKVETPEGEKEVMIGAIFARIEEEGPSNESLLEEID